MTDPTTPAPAKTTATMTAHDVVWIDTWAPAHFPAPLVKRIVATHAALQAKTEECEALRAEIQTHAQWAANFAKTQDGEAWLTLIRERDEARAALKEAQKDAARLDWLQAQGLFCSPPPMRAVRGYEWAVRAVGPLGEMPQNDVRAAIDAARAGGANG